MKIICLLIIPLFITFEGVASSKSECVTLSGDKGVCMSIYNCEPLLALVNEYKRTPQEVELLKQSQCGFDRNEPAVCCPSAMPYYTLVPQRTDCITPEGKGRCISIYSCPKLSNLLLPPVSKENIQYIQQSKCQGREPYSVCCMSEVFRPIQNDKDPIAAKSCANKVSAFPPDPATKCCGLDSAAESKILVDRWCADREHCYRNISESYATLVDMYPWLVTIEYEKPGSPEVKLLCGGALISGKYVLTAGHCVKGQILDMGIPKRVRLGDYDIQHPGADCALVEAGGQDCTDGEVKVDIERTIPHPQYDPSSPLKRHDIALLRLKQMALYTDFIRPICLPTVDTTLAPPPGFTLYAAGWGADSTRQSSSILKLHVDLPFISQDKCQSAYTAPSGNLPLWKGQMCAGGQKGKDSCKGDSGGPLMYENGQTYEATGVVSFGPIPCGVENVPVVYTKVFEYLDWIRNSITA